MPAIGNTVKSRNRLLIAIALLYLAAFLINYAVRHVASWHGGKDDGIGSTIILHSISCYLFFILLRTNFLSLLGAGFAAGLFSCMVAAGASNLLPKCENWYNYLLQAQLVAVTIVICLGIAYSDITNQNTRENHRTLTFRIRRKPPKPHQQNGALGLCASYFLEHNGIAMVC